MNVVPMANAPPNESNVPARAASSSAKRGKLKRAASAIKDEDKRYLPSYFVPSSWDVVCAKGKKYFMHPGNQRFRAMVARNLKGYQNTTSAKEKSRLVHEIINAFRDNSDEGGFVKQDTDGRWFEIGTDAAREKVSRYIRQTILRKYPPTGIDDEQKQRASMKAREALQETEKMPPSIKLARPREPKEAVLMAKRGIAGKDVSSAKSEHGKKQETSAHSSREVEEINSFQEARSAMSETQLVKSFVSATNTNLHEMNRLLESPLEEQGDLFTDTSEE